MGFDSIAESCQSFYNTQGSHIETPLFFESSKDPTSPTHILNRFLYQPVVDTAEWASFLLLNKDIEREYEKHLLIQIKEVYSTTESLFPELLEKNDYEYLKKIIKEWKNGRRK